MADATIRVDADTRGAERALGRLQNALGALSVGVVAKQFADLADQATNLRNRLNLVSDSVAQNNLLFSRLIGIANDSRTPLSQTGDLFFRIARASDSLGISQEQALQATNNVAKAITASGISAAEAAGPLLQLGQALQSGRLQGDELRSILEGLPPVARALANSLGVPIGALKELGAQGKISGKQVVDAILEAGDAIENDFGKTLPTIGQQFILLNNSLIRFADTVNSSTNASSKLGKAFQNLIGFVNFLGDNIDAIITTVEILGSIFLFGKVVKGVQLLGKLFISLGQNIKSVGFIFTNLATSLGGGLKTAVKLIRTSWKSLFTSLEKTTDGFSKYWLAAFGGFGTVIKNLGYLARNLGVPITAAVAYITGAFNYLKDRVVELLEYLGLFEKTVSEATIPAPEPPVDLNKVPDSTIFDQEAIDKAAAALKAIEDGYRNIRQQLLPLSSAHEEYGRMLIQIERAFAEGLFVEYDDYVKAKERLDQQYALAKIEAQNAITDQMTAFQDKEIDAIIRKFELEQAYIAKTDREYAISQQRRIAAELKARGLSDKDAQDAAQKRLEFDKKSEFEKAQFAIEQGASVFNELGKANKQAFQAAKAFNIANAVMNTYAGATKALATYPPPFNFIAAAAVVASGLAQVAQIRSQQYSGRALGGPVMAGESYIVGERGPELFTPATSGGITRNNDLPGGNTNITFNIQTNDARGFDQLLAERKPMIINMIRTAQNDRGNNSNL